MNQNQLKCLSAAEAESMREGLQIHYGGGWHSRDESFHANTVRSLVDKGYLRLYVSGAVAHITDVGQAALDEARQGLRDA